MLPNCQGRSKVQLFAFAAIVVLLIVLLFHQKTEVYYYYEQLANNPANGGSVSSNNAELNRKFNLMEETVGFGRIKQIFSSFNSKECTIEFINSHKLQQDHPCVIEIIRSKFLNKPSPPEVPLNLNSNDDKDRSPGQTGVVFNLLKNKTNGFFIECGALDGEYMSNTIDLERKFAWTGLLIEANPSTFKKLYARNRKSWTAPVCLSLEPYPTQVTFQPKSGDPGHSHIEGAAKTLQKAGVPGVDPDLVTIQCFPLYSILLAVGRVQVDFFSLDVEGHEIEILKTIPWHRVDIKTFTIEWDNIADGQEALNKFMKESGYLKIGAYDFMYSRDVIFLKS